MRPYQLTLVRQESQMSRYRISHKLKTVVLMVALYLLRAEIEISLMMLMIFLRKFQDGHSMAPSTSVYLI